MQNAVFSWQTSAALPELAIPEGRPQSLLFRKWLDKYALPMLKREVASRRIGPESEARILIARSPYQLMASKTAKQAELQIRAWKLGIEYRWEWEKAQFDILHSDREDVDVVNGYSFGNVGLSNRGGWTLTHIPSGLGFCAYWSTLEAAKAGTLAIHKAFHLARVDDYEKFTDAEKLELGELVKKHREYK